MLRDNGGELYVEFTKSVFCTCEVLDFSFSRASSERMFTHFLLVRAIYDVVHLYTNNKMPVEALRLKSDTITLELFDRLHDDRVGGLIRRYGFIEGLEKLQIQQGDIDPTYNCHGYCFADSKYWINNDQVHRIIQEDSYLKLKDDTEVAIVLFSQGDAAKHTAKRHLLTDGFNYISKAGVRGLEKTTSLEEAARGLLYDNVVVYGVRT
jgi:hypothetical protein